MFSPDCAPLLSPWIVAGLVFFGLFVGFLGTLLHTVSHAHKE